MANRPRFRLTDLDLDEISQVVSGDDPTASIMIVKNDPLEKMTGPSGQSLSTDQPLSSEFKHKDKMKRKKKKDPKRMRQAAMDALDEMDNSEEDEAKGRKPFAKAGKAGAMGCTCGVPVPGSKQSRCAGCGGVKGKNEKANAMAKRNPRIRG